MRKLSPEKMLLRYVLADRPYIDIRHTPTYKRMEEVFSLYPHVTTKIDKRKKLYHARVDYGTGVPESGVISCSYRFGVRNFISGYEEQYRIFEVDKSKISKYIYVPEILNLIYKKGLMKHVNKERRNILSVRHESEDEFIIPYVEGILIPTKYRRL